MRRTKNFLCAFLVVVFIISHFALAYHSNMEGGGGTSSVNSAGRADIADSEQAFLFLVPEHISVVIIGLGAVMLKNKK